MPKARIFQPDKTAMQSGKGGMKEWRLELVPETPLYVEGLMGWTGSKDTTRQIKLTFPTREAAENCAKEQGMEYEVQLPKPRKLIKKSYADNFSFGRFKRKV